MKKIICIIGVLIVVFSMSSCSIIKKNKEHNTNEISELLTQATGKSVKSDVSSTTTESTLGSSTTTTTKSTLEPSTFSTTSTIQSTASTRRSEVSAYQLYKSYFYKNFSKNDSVYLIDLTHDGQDDMIVVCEPAGTLPFFAVYTVKKGNVAKIYESSFRDGRSILFLTSKSGESNLVTDFNGIAQGMGTRYCNEFYLTNMGQEVSVNSFELRYGGDWDARNSYSDDVFLDSIDKQFELDNLEFGRKVRNCYGEAYKNIYLLHNDSLGFEVYSPQLNSNPSAVFKR